MVDDTQKIKVEGGAVKDQPSPLEQAKAEVARLEKARSDELLSSSAGLRDTKQEIPKEETAEEYAKKVLSGAFNRR